MPLLLLLVPVQMVQAHGGMADALVTFTPALPTPGQLTSIQVVLRDPYNNPIPNAQVRVSVSEEKDIQAILYGVTLRQITEGIYDGKIKMPQTKEDVIRLEVTFSGIIWSGISSISIGSTGEPVSKLDVPLVQTGEASPQVQPQSPPPPSAASAETRAKSIPNWLIFSGLGVLAIACVGALRRSQ
jgi:hypothetical protein